MFWNKKQKQAELSVASCLNDTHYSIAAVKNNTQVIFSQKREFNEDTRHLMAKTLAGDVERWNLIAHDCQLVLLPKQYQLILMDALDVPETEMATALRWSMKGLSDYDLATVAIDAFLMPVTDGQKKAFVAITPQSAIDEKRALFESAFLEVTTISIAEMALKNVVTLISRSETDSQSTPMIVISINDNIRKLHIVYNEMFYLIRELTSKPDAGSAEPAELDNIAFEIEQSINYCVNKLNLPEPKQLLFTPGFYPIIDRLHNIEEKVALRTTIIDLNHYLTIEQPLSLEEQHGVFYSIAGALCFNQDELTV
ncbi:MAG: hypothetical protein A3F46_00220 [Legionellales bacterium RIFCSPHIGHO2_12_FULL_42_9]|nr:MAG: hypothetical protein A3F46_00220 [Legionellales bacterium RIFCSPHIGHO2_12_FULL_42_9]